jgi:hypothetical protein
MSVQWLQFQARVDPKFFENHTIPPEVQQLTSQLQEVNAVKINTDIRGEFQFSSNTFPALTIINIQDKLAYYLITANNGSLVYQEPGFPVKFNCSGNVCSYKYVAPSTASPGLSPGAIAGIIIGTFVLMLLCAFVIFRKK